MTIEITNEVYDKLVELATEMVTQDNRGTAMPFMFQIRDWKKDYDWSGNGNQKIWLDFNSDYNEIETIEHFISYLKYNGIDHPPIEDLDSIWNDEHETIEWKGEYLTLNDFIENYTPDLKECSYSLRAEYSNSFFTAKAAQWHLDLNKHHFHKDADVYLNHAWRNPEMSLISNFLCSLAPNINK